MYLAAMDFFDQLTELNRPTVHKKPWMDKINLLLATAEDLPRIVGECLATKLYGLDIETTGLDARVFVQADGSRVTNDKIVGVCIAPNETTSYYIPMRHRDDGADANIPPRLVRDALLKIQEGGAVSVFHNGKFDIEFLEHDPAGAMGNWDNRDTWEDTLILAYLRDSREKRRGLKDLSKNILDREMIELSALFPSEMKTRDFSTLDPRWSPTVWYAAADALNTLALFKNLHPQVVEKDEHGKGQAALYKIEKMCVTSTRWMERCRVPIDRETIKKLIKLGQREWFESLTDLYAGIQDQLGRDVRPGWFKVMQGQHHRINDPFDPDCMEPSYMEHRERVLRDVGPDSNLTVPKSVPTLTDPKVRETVEFPATYDVTIPSALGLLLRELGVEGLSATEKSGQIQTSKDVLNRIIEDMGDDLTFAPKIKRFREVAKGLSSNLFPVYHDLAPECSPDGRLWVGFNGMRADTGRFATPASEDREFTGQSRWNLHSTPATYDKSKPECVRKMRTSVKAKPGRILAAIDFSGVELRIVTNLSGEPKWVKEFFRCSACDTKFELGTRPPSFCPNCWSDKIGDLHTLTALAIYGENAPESADFKQMRQSSKSLNFAMCYGGGGTAAQRAVGVDKEEGWRIKRQFDKSYTGLSKWWDLQHRLARKQKYVTTAFGRKYPLPDIDHPDGFFRSKAERNATNGPVQGCLHPDVRITTADGIDTVKNLFDKHGIDGRFKVWTGQGWSDARPMFSGKKPVVRTTFSSGTDIKTSPEHLFMSWRGGHAVSNFSDAVGWTRQDALDIGSWVASSTVVVDWQEPCYDWESSIKPQSGHLFEKGCTPHNYKGFAIHGNSEYLWEFLGLVYGDGSISNGGFIVHVGEPDIVDYEGPNAHDTATSYCARVNTIGVGAHLLRVVKTEPNKRDMWQVVVANTAFRDFCREVLGVEDQNTYTKRLPKALWSESARNRAAFLRGYFSADGGASESGDHISVRSVNLPLLRDAHELLRSIGIRSSYRPNSLRVSALDRVKYRDLVGFLVHHKAERAAKANDNPWAAKTDSVPPNLVRWVGKLVRGSYAYQHMDANQKSAVYQLEEGNGTRRQCQRYIDIARLEDLSVSEGDTLSQFGDVDITTTRDKVEQRYADIVRLLGYTWEKVELKTDLQETVDMYDVEVLDDLHAFVADGMVVHNTSADITKYAMALVYQELKKRGWLDKVQMCITIHDELVFEIDEDVAEEAMYLIDYTMTIPTVDKLNWVVPIKTDIEFGDDWTVPFNLVGMTNPKDTKPEVWSERWRRVFPKTYAQYLANGGTGVESDSIPSVAETKAVVTVEPLKSDSSGNFVFVVRKLTPETADALVRVIRRCMGRGKDHIRVESESGIDLIGWSFQASFSEFKVIAEYEGL